LRRVGLESCDASQNQSQTKQFLRWIKSWMRLGHFPDIRKRTCRPTQRSAPDLDLILFGGLIQWLQFPFSKNHFQKSGGGGEVQSLVSDGAPRRGGSKDAQVLGALGQVGLIDRRQWTSFSGGQGKLVVPAGERYWVPPEGPPCAGAMQGTAQELHRTSVACRWHKFLSGGRGGQGDIPDSHARD